jgi:hypothetical protein
MPTKGSTPDLVVVSWDGRRSEIVLMPSYRQYAAHRSPSTISSHFANGF